MTFEPTSEIARAVAKRASDRRPTSGKPQGLLREMQQGRADLLMVNPYAVTVKDGFNSRDFEDAETVAHVLALADDMSRKGFDPTKPMVVYIEDGRLVLSDGECRLRAVHYALNHLGADIRLVPVVAEPRGLNDAQRVAAQNRHNSGKRFSPLEQAACLLKLRGFGWTTTQIRDETGISPERQSQLLSLAEMPETVKAEVRAGRVAASQAATLLRDNAGDGAKTVEQVRAAVDTSVARGGMARATRRSLDAGSRKPSPMSELRSLVEGAVQRNDDVVDHSVILRFDPHAWRRVRDILGVE